MRSPDIQEVALYSYVSPEQRVPADHPLRPIREMVNGVLRTLSPEFDKIYSIYGRPSIPPERLLRCLLLQVLYTVRSERMMMEQLDYNVLYRWFVGLNMDDPTWDVTVFTKNRMRFLDGEIADKFFSAVLDKARGACLLSEEHFTVDGTLIEAWASHKSFKPKLQGPPIEGCVKVKNPNTDFRTISAPTKHTLPRQIRTHDSIRRALAARPSWVTSGMCSWRTATVWLLLHG
jgi:transposase